MEKYIRLSAERIETLRTEYFNDPLFATFHTAITRCVTEWEELTPPEVWIETQLVISQLRSSPRPDKMVYTIYNELLDRYSVFYSADGATCEARSKKKAEATAVTVMTCVMFSVAQPKVCPKINEQIARNILNLFQKADGSYHSVFEYLYAEQRIDEEQEENQENPVPDINPLEGPTKGSNSQCSTDTYLHKALNYYCCKLEREEVVAHTYMETDAEGETRISRLFDAVCQDQQLLELFGRRSLSIETLKDYEKLTKSNEPYDKAAAKGDYNVKLLCNFMGMLKDEGILTASADSLSRLFFTDHKATYFQPGKYMAFGKNSSAIPSKEVYDLIQKLIKESKTSY